MSASESDCNKFELLLDALRDGELSSDERRAVEQHAASCLRCQGQLADIERVVATLRALPRVKPPRDFSQDLDKLIAPRPRAKVVSLRPLIWGSLGAAAVAAVAVVAFKLTPGFGPTNAVAVREGSDTKEQRLHEGTPLQRQETTTAVAHYSDNAGPQQAVPLEHGSLQPGSVVATAPGDVQQAPQPPADDVAASHPEHKLPAGAQPGKTEKMPQTNDQAETKSPDKVPQQSGPGRTLSGRTAVAEAYDDDPFAGGAAVVALASGDQTGITEEIGLETDEDGLYAIKM